jgi:serine/threonine protein kinase
MVDVYSFGVLLFVLVSGEQDVVHLLERAKDEDVVDEAFRGDSSCNDLEIHRVLAVARQCTKFEPSDRPTMSRVTMMLNGDHPSESLSSFVVHKNIIPPFGYNTKQVDFLSQMATPTYLNLSERLWELNWEQRLNIAIGVAEALAYLHDNAPHCIVHGNINSGCIVFDPYTNQAYVTGFEFARFMQQSDSKIQVSTSTGRRGYMDPHLELSTKVDVYSFGVLLCVLVSKEQDIVHLVDRARTRDVMDVDFFKQDRKYKAHEARRVLAIARKCIAFEPTKRPPMSRIVTMLRNIHLSSFQLALLKLLPS